MRYEMEATELRNGQWAVRPKGALGTHGFHPYPYEVIYVTASSGGEALHKAAPEARKQQEAAERRAEP